MKPVLPLLFFSVIAPCLFQCASPTNPWKDPANVRAALIIGKATLARHPDSTFSVGDSITLGLACRIANLIDSCRITFGSDTSFSVSFTNATEDDTLWYTLAFAAFGSTLIRLHADVKGGRVINDSLTVTVLNNVSTLASLSCSGGALSPQFTSGNLSYTVKVREDSTAVAIAATLADTNATMVQNPPNPVPLSKDSTVATVTVVSADKRDTSVYEVLVILKPYTFSKTYGAGVLRSAIQLYDGYCYCAGDKGVGVIIKINPNGTEAKRIEPAGVTYLSDIIATPDSAFIACGSNGAKDGWLAKINVDLNIMGNVVAQGTGLEDRFETITAKHNDAGFIATGEFSWDRTWNTGDSWFVTVDPKAVFVGYKNFGGPARDYVLDITQAPGTGFLFVGYYFPSAQADGLAWLGKVDETGTSLQVSKMYSAPKGMGFSGVVPTPGGGSVCVGGKMVQATPNLWMPDGLVMRCNDAGDSLWTRQFGADTTSDNLMRIVAGHDGGYLCVGGNGAKGWLLKIDDNGNKVWEKTYDVGGNGSLFSVAKTSHQGYICTGVAGTETWVLRVNEKGDID